MRWVYVLGWLLLCAISSPLWLLGAILAWIHYCLVRGLGAAVKYGFWLPTRWPWLRFVAAYRAASASPSDPAAERRHTFFRKARRARRRGCR